MHMTDNRMLPSDRSQMQQGTPVGALRLKQQDAL
jgi:hypothetical protein